MGKKKSDGGLWIICGLAVGAVALYYLQAGRGEESDAALIPNDVEGRIDLVVAKLNKQFGKWWVNRGLDALGSYLESALPPQVVGLIGVIYQVEQFSKGKQMTGHQKRQTAVAWASRGI
jgi:hypothetical protein